MKLEILLRQLLSEKALYNTEKAGKAYRKSKDFCLVAGFGKYGITKLAL